MQAIWAGCREFILPLDSPEDTVSCWGLTGSPLGLRHPVPTAGDLDPGESAFAKNKEASQMRRLQP